jgi:hypothetical protein
MALGAVKAFAGITTLMDTSQSYSEWSDHKISEDSKKAYTWNWKSTSIPFIDIWDMKTCKLDKRIVVDTCNTFDLRIKINNNSQALVFRRDYEVRPVKFKIFDLKSYKTIAQGEFRLPDTTVRIDLKASFIRGDAQFIYFWGKPNFTTSYLYKYSIKDNKIIDSLYINNGAWTGASILSKDMKYFAVYASTNVEKQLYQNRVDLFLIDLDKFKIVKQIELTDKNDPAPMESDPDLTFSEDNTKLLLTAPSKRKIIYIDLENNSFFDICESLKFDPELDETSLGSAFINNNQILASYKSQKVVYTTIFDLKSKTFSNTSKLGLGSFSIAPNQEYLVALYLNPTINDWSIVKVDNFWSVAGVNNNTKVANSFLHSDIDNGTLNINISDNTDKNANISLFDLNGNKIADIFAGAIDSDNFSIKWNVAELAAGTYIVKVEINGVVEIVKILL